MIYTTSVKEVGISVMGSDVAMKRNSMSPKRNPVNFSFFCGLMKVTKYIVCFNEDSPNMAFAFVVGEIDKRN